MVLNVLRTKYDILEILHLHFLFDIGIALLHEGPKLHRPIIKPRLHLLLHTPELVNSRVIKDLHVAVGTGDVGVEHEDHIDGVGIDLLGRRVPEHTWVVWLALLQGKDEERGEEEERK